VLFCFLAGVFARTKLARKLVSGLESKVLFNLPGYEFFKAVGESILGVEADAQQVVLARFDDYWQGGFPLGRLRHSRRGPVFTPAALAASRFFRAKREAKSSFQCIRARRLILAVPFRVLARRG